MIGVDTNVLIRLYVADDAAQHDWAVSFFAERSESSQAYISLIVLVEFLWSLTRTYRYGWGQVYALVAAMTATSDIRIEREDIVIEALVRATEDNVGFIDAIVAMANQFDGCETTMTFDKAAARRIVGMELLA